MIPSQWWSFFAGKWFEGSSFEKQVIVSSDQRWGPRYRRGSTGHSDESERKSRNFCWGLIFSLLICIFHMSNVSLSLFIYVYSLLKYKRKHLKNLLIHNFFNNGLSKGRICFGISYFLIKFFHLSFKSWLINVSLST